MSISTLKKNTRRSLLAACSLAAILAVGAGIRSPQVSYGQDDDSAYEKRVETRYETVIKDGVTTMVPRTHTVYVDRNKTPAYRYSTTIRRTPAPHDVEIGKLLRQIGGNTRDLKINLNTDDVDIGLPDKEELKEKLKDLLGKQFDAMSKNQQRQIDELSERLEKLRSQHRTRSEARGKIIDRRMKELLNEPDPLSWYPNQSRPNVYDHPVMTPTIKRGITVMPVERPLTLDLKGDVTDDLLEDIDVDVEIADEALKAEPSERNSERRIRTFLYRKAPAGESAEHLKRAIDAAREAIEAAKAGEEEKPLPPKLAEDLKSLESALRSVLKQSDEDSEN